MGKRLILALLACLSPLACLSWAPARAEDFYAGKTITIIVSSGTSGSYGAIAFAISRHMSKYLPGHPAIVVKGMPGAGNILATNYLYNIAAKDGTEIGLINNAIPLHQILDGRGVKYDAMKFNWLGSTGAYNSVTYAWWAAGVKTIRDAMSKKVVLGGTGVGSSIVMFPTVMNSILGTKFDIVTGYHLTTDIDVAMERGEVQARSGSYAELKVDHPDWIKEHKIVNLVQVGPRPDPEMGAIPLMTDLAANELDRKVLALVSSPIALGRPFLAPPGTPAKRVAELRSALQATFRDKGFLAEMAKERLEISPTSGEYLERVIAQAELSAPAVVQRAKWAMGNLTKGGRD